MKRRSLGLLALVGFCCMTVARADTPEFGVASAYNLVALTGDINDTSDITGRIAAAYKIDASTTIGSWLNGTTADPYASLASGYAVVAGSTINASNYFNINGGGNVYQSYSSSTVNVNWNESPKGTVVTGGTSPVNFAALTTTLDSLTAQLASMTSNGTLCQFGGSGTCAPNASGAKNPSFLVLYGTSSTLNVFTVTAAQFSNQNSPLDIEVPVGSTVVINVQGVADTLNTGIYYNGVQETDANASKILFNFANAQAVTIDGQLDGSILAPYAYLTGTSQMGGTMIAASVGPTGEVHYDAFTGNVGLVATPEPASLALLGMGLLMIMGTLRYKMRSDDAAATTKL